MLVAESRRGRRIVGRLDRGQDLFAALTAVCRDHHVRAGELRALGSLESAEVAEYDQTGKRWKPARVLGGGGLELLSLTGNVSERDGHLVLQASVSLMRDRDSGVELLGGHLVAARVFALEFVIDSWDDVILRRAADTATGLALWNQALEVATPAAVEAPAPRPAAAPPASPPQDESPVLPPRFEPVLPKASISSSPSWTQVADASARKGPVAAPDEPDDALQAGDILLHPTFGRCEVQRIEGSNEFAHVRLKNGRTVRLSLDVLRVTLSGDENGRRLFKARVSG
jgi:uncharacterized protein